MDLESLQQQSTAELERLEKSIDTLRDEKDVSASRLISSMIAACQECTYD
jgi:hypothetical protein